MARRRYQRGSLQLMKNKSKPATWRIVYAIDYIDGHGVLRRRRESQSIGSIIEVPTERAARRLADLVLMKEGINSADYKPKLLPNFYEIVVMYKKEILPNLKESTQLSLRSCIDHHIIPSLGHIRVDNLNNYLVQTAVNDWAKKDLSQKTLKNIMMAFKAIYIAAKDWGFRLGEFNYTAIQLPRKKKITKAFSLMPEQANFIIHASPYPINIMMLTLAVTGLRMGEVLGLTWKAVDFKEDKIRIYQTIWQRKVQTPKTETSVRVIPLPEALKQILLGYRKEWEPNHYGLLWATKAGEPLCGDNLRARILRPILDELKIEDRAGFHAFRHLHATMLVSLGTNAKVAQTQLGHSNLKTTMDFYVEALSEDHRNAVERLSEHFAQNCTFAGGQKGKSQQGANLTGSKNEYE